MRCYCEYSEVQQCRQKIIALRRSFTRRKDFKVILTRKDFQLQRPHTELIMIFKATDERPDKQKTQQGFDQILKIVKILGWVGLN